MATTKQAEKALQAVKRRFPWAEDEGGHIALIERDGHHEIIWEEGPYEWAIRATGGGFNEELFHQIYPEFEADKAKAVAAAETKPIKFPAGVYVEPVTSYSLGVY